MTELLENRSLMPDLLSPSFEHPPFKFTIIAAGFKPESQDATAALFKNKIKTPSIHLIGEADTLIVPERMMALADVFENPAILKHPGG